VVITDEQRAAYEYAYANGITTMNTITKARITDKITRAELAKMVSKYATNVLKKTPNTTKNCLAFEESIQGYKNSDLYQSMITACQLDIMGIHPNGVPISDFKPSSYVTRADF
jgi:hypothetical protein